MESCTRRHPLLAHKLSLLRDKNTTSKQFRDLVSEITLLLGMYSTADLALTKQQIDTPMSTCVAVKLAERIGIFPVMRAGLGMVDAMLQLIPSARVHHMGLYREKSTLLPVEYYNKLPLQCQEDLGIILDPMVATAGTAIATVTILKDWGLKRIKFIALIASREGLEALREAHPDLEIVVGAVDDVLTDGGYIIPGLGDAGDRRLKTISAAASAPDVKIYPSCPVLFICLVAEAWSLSETKGALKVLKHCLTTAHSCFLPRRNFHQMASTQEIHEKGNVAGGRLPDSLQQSLDKLHMDNRSDRGDSAGAHRSKPTKQSTKKRHEDVQQYMNIHHFEELMQIFQNEQAEGGGGFDLDQFREIFGKVFRGALQFDQLTQLFMKIDANSDGTVDWDEFSTYMMMGTINSEETTVVFDEQSKLFSFPTEQISPQKDMMRKVEFVSRERKYISVSRDGIVCIWNMNGRLQKTIDTKALSGTTAWVSDAICLSDQGKLAILCDDRKLYVYDVLSLKARLLAIIGPMADSPLCVDYCPIYDDTNNLLLWGDDGGHVNFLFFGKRFFIDNFSEDKVAMVNLQQLGKKENQEKYQMSFHRRKVHKDWVLRVQYSMDLTAFISCSVDASKTLAIGDIDRRATRYVHVSRGIKCFALCHRPALLVTGGSDKIIRLWNPYVLDKRSGMLVGHNAGIEEIVMNHEAGHIISLAEDKVVKIWNARTLQCLQTLYDKRAHHPENVITALHFDSVNFRLVVGHDCVEVYDVFRHLKSTATRSHDAPVVAALFNDSFHQVVSGCQMGFIRVWNPTAGDRVFQFRGANDDVEMTAMAFDKTHRRLLVGGRDGIIRMYNFNNGQLLQQMMKPVRAEITQILYVEVGRHRYIAAVGWDRRISLFEDDPGNFNTEPLREIHGDNSSSRSHQDDIIAMDFCPPNLAATAGIDGLILVWSLESNQCKSVLRDPFLDFRNQEERSVEKVLFLAPKDDSIPPNTVFPLASGHADGYLRLWDPVAAQFLCEIKCQYRGDEGVTALATDLKAQTLLVGDTCGNVRIFDIRNFKIGKEVRDYLRRIRLVTTFRAHTQPITHIGYIQMYTLILTASRDGSIRLWTHEGRHIGIFGQNAEWDITVPTTFSSLPNDVARANAEERLSPEKAVSIKTDIIRRLKVSPLGITDAMVQATELELRRELRCGDVDANVLRYRLLMRATANRWKDFVHRRRAQIDYSIVTDSILLSPPQFFTLDTTSRKERRSISSLDVKSDAVYHHLVCHPLGDIIVPHKPGQQQPATQRHNSMARAGFAAVATGILKK